MKTFLKSSAKILCAGLLIFLIYGTIKTFFTKESQPKPVVKAPVVSVTYDNLTPEILNALEVAHKAAYDHVETSLDIWIEGMLTRVDDNFLDEYFSFMQMKKRELQSLWKTVVHFFYGNAETAEEAAIRELEEEIERKVIRPEISQKRIENITDEAISIYASTLDEEFLKIQTTYNIPTLEWNKYISDICGLTLDIKTKNYPIALKAAVVTSGAAITYAVTPVLKNVAIKVSKKISEKVALKTGAKVAEKAATKVTTKAVAKGAGKLGKAIPIIGWGVTAATCIWDVVDYVNTSSEGKVLLKQNLTDYFQEIKTELLCSTDQSIMGTIINWENGVKTNIVN